MDPLGPCDNFQFAQGPVLGMAKQQRGVPKPSQYQDPSFGTHYSRCGTLISSAKLCQGCLIGGFFLIELGCRVHF